MQLDDLYYRDEQVHHILCLFKQLMYVCNDFFTPENCWHKQLALELIS